MTAREARSRRRAEERRVRKLEIKEQNASRQATNETANFQEPACYSETGQAEATAPARAPEAAGFVSQPDSARAERNRQNSLHSTGPRTGGGKTISSRNSLQHGLAAGLLLIPGEDPVAFESLLRDLQHEHQPATVTEELLLREIAESYWLEQRAIRFQTECFTSQGIDEKRLALFLRYQTTYHRRFHKALNTLRALQKDRQKAERGFVSQTSAPPAREAGFVSQKRQPHHFEELGFAWVDEADFPHSESIAEKRTCLQSAEASSAVGAA